MRKSWWNKYICLLLCMSLVSCSILVFQERALVYADTASDLKEAQAKKEAQEKNLKNLQSQLASLKAQASNAEAYMRQLDEKMADVDGQIYDLNLRIDELDRQIRKKEQELKVAEAEAAEQYEMMKLRIKFMYEHNDESYLALLITSRSMGEMLNRAEYVQKISSYDREMLTRFEATVKFVSDTKAQLEKDNEELVASKDKLEEQKQSLVVMQEEKEKELKALQSQTTQIAALENKAKTDLAAMESQIKQMEETIRRQESGGGGSTVVGTGQFMWPTVSRRITSDYGDMEDRSSGHKGIDIGARSPGVWGDPIYAADSGQVTISGDGGTAGNWIWIYHGNGVYSVYMHCSKLYVSVGQTVKRGDTIALMGSTGQSTGAHLHFGVRKDGVYVNPWGYLK